MDAFGVPGSPTNDIQATSTDLTSNDIKKDLADCFYQLDFKGQISTPTLTLLDAPDPGLTVEGVNIDLPLNIPVARCMQYSALHSGELAVEFRNRSWEPATNRLAKDAAVALGISEPDAGLTRCAFRKLAICGPDSNLATQAPVDSTSRSERGVFGTLAILLPSSFSGGEFTLSYARTSATIDLAQACLGEYTVAFAWYDNVDLEISSTIISGYQFALLYDLIHPSVMALPDLWRVPRCLRQIFRKWSQDMYPKPALPHIFSFVLSTFNDSAWDTPVLQGHVRHFLSHFLPAAKEYGVSIYFGHLFNDGGLGWESESERVISPFVEVDREWQYMTNQLLFVQGKPLSDYEILHQLPKGSVHYPEGYKQWELNRAERFTGSNKHLDPVGMILYLEKERTDILVSTKGLPWACFELADQSSPMPPTNYAKELAHGILAKLESMKRCFRKNIHVDYMEKVPQLSWSMLRYAVEWKDCILWKRALVGCSDTFQSGITAIRTAEGVFDHHDIEDSLHKIYTRCPNFRLRVEFISSLIQRQDSMTFLNQLVYDALQAYTIPELQDVEAIVSLCRMAWLWGVQEILIPNVLTQAGRFRFLIALAYALNRDRPFFPQNCVPETITRCVYGALPEWNEDIPNNTNGLDHDNNLPEKRLSSSKPQRIFELVALCLAADNIPLCATVLDDVLHSFDLWNVVESFKDVYTPLIGHLVPMIRKLGRAVTASPFRKFFKTIISLYLEHILGDKAEVLPIPPLPTECTCDVCAELDRFLGNTCLSHCIRIKEEKRGHLEYILERGKGNERMVYQYCLSCNMDGSEWETESTLMFTKRPDWLAVYSWDERLAAAARFLERIGNEVELASLMDEKWSDVASALYGSQAFKFT